MISTKGQTRGEGRTVEDIVQQEDAFVRIDYMLVAGQERMLDGSATGHQLCQTRTRRLHSRQKFLDRCLALSAAQAPVDEFAREDLEIVVLMCTLETHLELALRFFVVLG